MEFIKYGKYNIPYTIKRSKRKKTLAISISPTAQVIVLSPEFLKNEEIEKLVKKKVQWIIEKQKYFKHLMAIYPEKEFISGEEILFLGRRYRLKIKKLSDVSEPILNIEGRRVVITINHRWDSDKRKEVIRNILKNWYLSKVEEIIEKRINRYSKQLGLIPKEIKIKDQKKRWGSCSEKGIIRFNWKIIMAPVSIIDYIVVHELCHLKIKNHSNDFWKLVSLTFSNYEKRRDWLKNNAGVFEL